MYAFESNFEPIVTSGKYDEDDVSVEEREAMGAVNALRFAKDVRHAHHK